MNRGFWVFLMFMAVAPFIVGAVILKVHFPGYLFWLWIAIAVTLIIHAFQVPTAMRIAKSKRIPVVEVIYKTMLFGFTWWKPLELGVWGGENQ